MIKFLKQLCAILTLLALWATNATANNESGDSNPKKIKIQSQIDRLDQGISKQQSKIKNTLKKEHSLYDELKNLDKLLLEKQNSNIRCRKTPMVKSTKQHSQTPLRLDPTVIQELSTHGHGNALQVV